MQNENTVSHTGECFCGAVKIRATGSPFAMGYCHCNDCRAWSAAPATSYTLWQPDAVEITEGADKLATFAKTPGSQRQFCSQCGGHVMSEHPDAGFTDILAPILPTLKFEPTVHVYYGAAVMRVPDGLPKLKDFPAEFGGSGETMPE